MKITVKKNLIIFHKPDEWSLLFQRLLREHGQKIAISTVCQRELGFIVRRHKGLEPHAEPEWQLMKDMGWKHRYHYQDQVHLDFYNEAAQTWFALKYLNNDAVDQKS
jgi:hypothetical protein